MEFLADPLFPMVIYTCLSLLLVGLHWLGVPEPKVETVDKPPSRAVG